MTQTEVDPFDIRRALRAAGSLRDLNDAGVLAAADVLVALRLSELGNEGDADVLLAAALAVRAPRLGHVCTDLATIRATVTVDTEIPVDLQALPWPDPAGWIDRLEASALVAVGEDGGSDRPLHLVGTTLYLDRYWREERLVAADLRRRGDQTAGPLDLPLLTEGLGRLFHASAPDYQRMAVATAVLRRFSLVAGGPGTGKTTTVARILALLHEQSRSLGGAEPLIALAAPTGKAAARLEQAVHEEAVELQVGADTRELLLSTTASTLHRLLGWRPDRRSRFRHHRGNRLPYDVVIVDETSMVSLTLMARLVEAVGTGARLILIGDPEQLASVEAGAVLGDIVGPAAHSLLMRPPARELLASVTGQEVPATDPPPNATIGDGIVVLRQVHRFRGGIAELAETVRRGDAGEALSVLGSGLADLRWIDVDLASPGAEESLDPVHQGVVAATRLVTDAARGGNARLAMEGLGAFRILCAHRHGPYGVSTWTSRVESWLGAEIEGFAAGGTWYPGRPLLVTENDYGLGVFNGDIGVIVAAGVGRVTAVFERRGELLELSPTRLAAVDTVHAMTIHKSQGSQFDTVAVLLPDPTSPILTRELLYTAVTRARKGLIVAGTEPAIRKAIERPIARASGLRRRLWDGGPLFPATHRSPTE